MATGRSLQLTKQVGEYLVAAELCRRGLIATTFTGNVPDYDIVAINDKGEDFLVQVKTIHGGSWQFGDVRVFVDVKLDEKKKIQIVGRKKKPKYPNLVYVFVRLDRSGRDRFFILKAEELHRRMAADHRRIIKQHKGKRARNWKSFHGGIKSSGLAKYEDRWEVITGSNPVTR
jgi:hypothetical protein